MLRFALVLEADYEQRTSDNVRTLWDALCVLQITSNQVIIQRGHTLPRYTIQKGGFHILHKFTEADPSSRHRSPLEAAPQPVQRWRQIDHL